MTCHLCTCGTEIRYNCVKDETVHCSGCDRVYTVDKETGKLIPPIEEFNLNKVDKMKYTDADKAFLCEHNKTGKCDVIHHIIKNGYASKAHCSNCSEFKLIEK